jgi:subtilase family serine protease
VKNVGDVLLTGTRGVGSLSGGATSTGTVTVVIPSGTAGGTYVLLACADDFGVLTESNEGNNCVASAGTVQIDVANVVDLVETAVSNPPATAVPGGGFSVTDTVQNVGAVTAGVSTTRYYLSLDSAKSAGDVLLTGSRSVGTLNGGVTSTGTVNVVIPGGTAAGTYRLLACADDVGAVTESNEANNCVAAQSTVQVGGATAADLVETMVSNPPAAAVAGTVFSVTDTVQNVGGLTAAGTTTRYYLSLDGVKNAGDVVLTGTRGVGTLSSGATSTGTVTVIIPSGTAAGTYVLLACADDVGAVTESNEANNCVASAGTVQVGLPDLVETVVSNPPTAAPAGAFFAVTDTVQNVGAVAAGGTTTRYYLSLDGVKNAGDVLLTGTRGVGSLNGGATSTGTVTVVIPSGTAAGTYVLLACADDFGAVTESNEANNCVASAGTVQVGLPDLVETAVSNPPVTAVVGTVFSVTDTVQYVGAVAAGGTTTRYYLSLDGVKNVGDVLLTGTRGVGSLSGGATSTGTVTVVIPSGTAGGTYVLLACADDFGAVTESTENNNCVASSSQVSVSP